MSTVSNSVNSVTSVISVNSYSAVLHPSPMVFFFSVLYFTPPVLEPWLEQLPGQQLLQLEVSLLPERSRLPVLLQT